MGHCILVGLQGLFVRHFKLAHQGVYSTSITICTSHCYLLGLSSNPFFKIQITHESFPKSTKSAAIQNQFLRKGICSKSLPNPDRIWSQFSHIF